jgi:hypothetical protein
MPYEVLKKLAAIGMATCSKVYAPSIAIKNQKDHANASHPISLF